MNKEVSNCCQSLATVNGNTTKYYVCDNCGEPCDLLETNPQPPIEGWKKSLDRFDKQFFDRDVIENYRKLKSIYKYASTDKFIVDIEKFIVQELQAKDKHYEDVIKEIKTELQQVLKAELELDRCGGIMQSINTVYKIAEKHNININ